MVDLSHPFEQEPSVWPVDINPLFAFPRSMRSEPDALDSMSKHSLSMVKLPMERYHGTGVVVDIPKDKCGVVTPEDLENATPRIEKGDIVIVHTGNHRAWGDNEKYFGHRPGMNKAAADWLVAKEVKAFGIDCPAIDHPEWNLILNAISSNGIPGFENVGGDIELVVGKRVTVSALPVKVDTGNEPWIRIVAFIDEDEINKNAKPREYNCRVS